MKFNIIVNITDLVQIYKTFWNGIILPPARGEVGKAGGKTKG